MSGLRVNRCPCSMSAYCVSVRARVSAGSRSGGFVMDTSMLALGIPSNRSPRLGEFSVFDVNALRDFQ